MTTVRRQRFQIIFFIISSGRQFGKALCGALMAALFQPHDNAGSTAGSASVGRGNVLHQRVGQPRPHYTLSLRTLQRCCLLFGVVW